MPLRAVSWALAHPSGSSTRGRALSDQLHKPVSTLGSTSRRCHLGLAGSACFGPSHPAPPSSALCPPPQSRPGKMCPARLRCSLRTALPWAAPSWTQPTGSSAGPGRNLFYPGGHRAGPGRAQRPPAPRAHRSSRRGLLDADRGLPEQRPVPTWPVLEARPAAARKAGRLSPEPPAGSSLSARLARLRGAALRCAALRSSPDRAGAAGCRVSASAACRAGSGGG